MALESTSGAVPPLQEYAFEAVWLNALDAQQASMWEFGESGSQTARRLSPPALKSITVEDWP